MDPLSSTSSLSSLHVSVVPSELLFNHKTSSSLSSSSASSRSVSITNRTRGKLRYLCMPHVVVFSVWINTYVLLLVFVIPAPAWCGRLPLTLRSPFLPRRVTSLRLSPPHSEWPMTPSSSILCMQHSSSALHTIRWCLDSTENVWRNVSVENFSFVSFATPDAAGQSSRRTAVSAPVCDGQGRRPLLPAGQRAFHPVLLPAAPSSGETSRVHTSQYIFLPLSVRHLNTRLKENLGPRSSVIHCLFIFFPV